MLRTTSPSRTRDRTVVVAVVLATALAYLAPGTLPAAASEVPDGVHDVALRVAPDADLDALAATVGAAEVRPLVARHGLWVLTFTERSRAVAAPDQLEDLPGVRWSVPHEQAAAPVASHRSWAWADVDAHHRSWAWADGDVVDHEPAALWQDSLLTATLGLEEAHLTGRGGGTVVAILDTGVDVGHPALAGADVRPGWDLLLSDPEPGTDLVDPWPGHGTAVASLVHLVAPDATLVPIRVLDRDGRGSLATLILGIELATEAGVDVINLSLGTDAASNVLEDVVNEARAAGIVLVAAAGNRGTDVVEYPASLDEVVAVAAVDATGTAAPFTSYGERIDLAAPGVGLLAPAAAGGWAWWSGTSVAAPLVTGQAALLAGLDADHDAEEVVDLIKETVVELERLDGAIGEGRIDVGASVRALLDD